MKIKDYLALFLISAALVLAAARFLPVPGYMDAEYYYANSTQLATGRGFYEPFLWNYLDDPVGIPHPANTYWMPLASIISAMGLLITGKADFLSARIFFFLIASSIPLLTAFISWRFSHKRIIAWLAGGLAIFPGYYAIYMGISDTFAIYMLLATCFLLLAAGQVKPRGLNFFLLGMVAGLMHLTRADGILWLAFGAGLVIFEVFVGQTEWHRKTGMAILATLSLALGYMLVMLPWYARNLSLYGGLFSPAGGRVLWLINYDQMFVYPASQLGFQNWLSSGLANILQVRVNSLGANLETALAVQAEIFLLPMLALGAWRLRKERIVRLALVMWLVTFFVMTLVFPLAGGRGGFLHSGAAFQPFFWALSAEGFVGLIEIGVKKRHWKFERATRGFGFLMILVVLLLTLALFLPQVIPESSQTSAWTRSGITYQTVDLYLVGIGAGKELPVVVNNPPGYYVATGRPAIVIPDGNIDTVVQVANRYGAHYLVLEENTVSGLRDLYKHPRSVQGLAYIQSVGEAQIFEIVSP